MNKPQAEGNVNPRRCWSHIRQMMIWTFLLLLF